MLTEQGGTQNHQFLKLKFDRFLKILRGLMDCGTMFVFYKSTSVITPSSNSYIVKFFRNEREQMQGNYGHDATEGSRSFMKTKIGVCCHILY